MRRRGATSAMARAPASIPDGVRRFATWAPLLIPFYIPRGAEWDKAWTGAEALHNAGGPMPGPVRTLAIAYGDRRRRHGARARLSSWPRARKTRRRGPRARRRARRAWRTCPALYRSTMARSASISCATGAARRSCWATTRDSFAIDLTRRPLDPLQSRGQFFYISEEGASAVVDRLRAGAPRRRLQRRGDRPQPASRSATRSAALAASMEIGARSREGAVLTWRIRLADQSGGRGGCASTSFAEIAAHETGAYARDLDFAGMHVETFFIAQLNAIFARNRLLRSPRAGRSEMAFFAARPVAAGVGSSATRIRARASSARARSPTPTGSAPGDARKPTMKASCGPSIRRPASRLEVELDAERRRRDRIHRRARRQRMSPPPISSRDGSNCRPIAQRRSGAPRLPQPLGRADLRAGRRAGRFASRPTATNCA